MEIQELSAAATTIQWYQSTDTRKNVRQIVVEIPPAQDTQSQFGMMFFGAKYLQLMTNTWTTGFFRMDSDPGPFLLVRGDRAAGKLRGLPLRLAFAFYRMRAGGIFAIYLEIDSPEVKEQLRQQGLTVHAPRILFETFYGLDTEDTTSLIRDGLARDPLRICFAEGDGPGEMSGGMFSGSSINAQFDVVVSIPPECRRILAKEWENILKYHKAVPPASRSFASGGRQLQAENPITESVVLGRSSNVPKLSEAPNMRQVRGSRTNDADGPAARAVTATERFLSVRPSTKYFLLALAIIIGTALLLWVLAGLIPSSGR